MVLPYACEQVYRLVSEIAHYPQFLPYCLDAKILEENQGVLKGTLRVGYKGLGYNFATQNRNQPPGHIQMELLSGPFQKLEGHWHFDPRPEGCQVRLELTLEFKHPLLGRLFRHKIEEVTDLMVQAFIDRAKELYA
jgi:ribosome-associated toxin RatA of RatAB toxin-antitoxin module